MSILSFLDHKTGCIEWWANSLISMLVFIFSMLLNMCHLKANIAWAIAMELIIFSSESKESACNAGDPGSIPGPGRFRREGNGNPFLYSCLEDSAQANKPSIYGCPSLGKGVLNHTWQSRGMARGWDNTFDDPRRLEGEKMGAIGLQRGWGWGFSLLGLQKITCLEWG